MYVLLSIMTVLHLVFFTQYAFDPHPTSNVITVVGEVMKTAVPYLLLLLMLPWMEKFADRFTGRAIVNVGGLALTVLCIFNQLADTPGQAWSTVAFSTLLILTAYNYLVERRKYPTTMSLVLSFMSVWAGWVVFETIFQVGLWFYHPRVYDGNFMVLIMSIRNMLMWLLPSLVYMGYTLWRRKARITLSTSLTCIASIAVIATFMWMYAGMLIPIPVDSNGVAYRLTINYWSVEHLEFSVSRLSQICIMGAGALLFTWRNKSWAE